jgi:hypothetical protein
MEMSDFMQPEVWQGTMVAVEHKGERSLFPEESFTVDEAITETCGDDWEEVTVARATGFWCRLSAPGYMDCTEWDGPYSTEAEALAELSAQYDLEG